MTGEKMPIVFFPRFTTVSGAGITYWSQPLDTLGLDNFHVTFYRSPVLGGGTVSLEFFIEHSADLDRWSEWTAPFDPSPGSNAAGSTDKAGMFGERYLRVGVKLGGDAPVSTLWAQGWAARTQT